MKRFIILAAVVLLSLTGLASCYAVRSTDMKNTMAYYSENEAVASYRNTYDIAVKKIALREYDAAEEMLVSLYTGLSEDDVNDVVYLKADTDYALGRVYDLKGSSEAYDHYNSAFVYYRDLYGEDAPKTADAKIKTALFGRKEDIIIAMDEILDSGADRMFKDIAYCIRGYEYVRLVNKKEIMDHFDKISGYLSCKELSGHDTENDAKLYGEDHESTLALGRLTRSDIYSCANDYMYLYNDMSDNTDECIRLIEEELDIITGDDLRSLERRSDLTLALATDRLYYKGENENKYISEALKLYETLYPEGSRLANVNITIAEKFFNTGDYESYKDYLLKASDLINKNPVENNRTQARINLRMAKYYDLTGEYDKAAESAEKSLEIYKARVEDDTEAIASAYNILANAYIAAGIIDKVQEYYEKAAEIYREHGYYMEYATTQRNRALITNNSFCNHSDAVVYARKAVSTVEAMDNDNEGKT